MKPIEITKYNKNEKFVKAIEYFNKRDFLTALGIFLTLLKEDPENLHYMYNTALTLANLGKEDEAIKYLEIVVKHSNYQNDYYLFIYSRLLLGFLYTKKERYEDAERLFKEVLRVVPDSTLAMESLGYVYERLGRYDQAIIHLRKAIELNPNSANALNSLGYIYAELGINLTEALQLCKRAVNLNPNNAAYRDSLGWVYYKRGELLQAKTELEKALYIDPNNPVIRQHLQEVLKAIEKKQ